MPTLNWIGKDKVVTHHNDVPFRVLDRKYTFGDTPDSGNMIIHGDNLEALKALLPEYENRIKCIYIDPPYNTGNENWVYNDNVNDPHIRRWLGKVVGSEIDDLTRHDKWLCMMYPRLVLLQRLLSEDGAIFISIDDNEQANLKLICDEIFGIRNYVASFLWKSTPGSNTGNDIKVVTEYVLMYKGTSFVANTRTIENNDVKYVFEDEYVERRGKYILNKLDRRMTGNHYSESLNYQIETPDGTMLYPGSSMEKQEHWNWRWSKTKVEWGIKNGFIVFKQNKGGWSIYFKQYYKVNNNDDIIVRTLPYQNLLEDESFNSARGTSDLMKIFNSKIFDYPKPISLIEELIKIATDKTSLILDSFAGSGTTAHAVLNLNKQDSGNRKFILCEMCDYAETITAERVRRVMKGYGEGKNAVTGTGGSFDFYELGETIFDPVTGNLNDNADTEAIRRYMWFSETNSAYIQPAKDAHSYLLGTFQHNNYYFYYKKGEETCLDWDFLNTFTQKDKAEMYIIYADRCVLTEEEMMRLNIRFKKIPRDIKRV